MVASGLLGFAIGAVIRHTAGAITAVVALLFVAPPLTQLLPGDWGHWVSQHFTVNAGQKVTEVVINAKELTPWAGYLTMTVWWVVPLLLGAWLIRRRDA